MPSDYKQISRENKDRYVPEVVRLMTMLLDQYAAPAHFVFELLQNAEDALRRREEPGGSRSVSFKVADGCVRLSHYGIPFNDRDVWSICGIAEGTKEEDLMAIGRFGIGFKSVNKVTETPEIHSGDEHFAIRDYFLPFSIPPIDLNDGETVIALPLREAGLENNLGRQLKRLGKERTLLFLRKINEIEWKLQDGSAGCCRREETVEGEGVRRIRLLSEAEGEDPVEESWLVFSRAVHSDGEFAGYVELAFKLASDGFGKDVIEAVDDSRLVAFFPTVIPTYLGMLVQGPYRTTPSRDNIPQDDPRNWNRNLVKETAALLVDALRWLRDHRMLGVHVFDALPLDRPRFRDDDNRFAALFDAVLEAVAQERLLPAHGRGYPYVRASHARLTTQQGLRRLVSRRQLAELVSEDEPVAWLAGDITEYGTPVLYDYLTGEHDVEKIDASDLLSLLNEGFLEGQDDKWVRRLYEFLNRQRPGNRQRPVPYLWHLVPLIRLEDGTHVALGYGDDRDIFFPTGMKVEDLKTVRSSVCDSKTREFLEWLGVKEFDRIEALRRNVILRYRSPKAHKSSQYATDLREIVSAYTAASPHQRGRLTDALRDAYFVRAVDTGTGELSFAKPSDVYLTTKQLRALFDGVPSVLFSDRPPRGLSRKDLETLLEACGASRTLAPVEFLNLSRFRKGERRRLRADAGYRHSAGAQESLIDSKFRGLEELLEYLPILPAEEAAARAGLLWNALREAARRPGQPGFKVDYSWRYHGRQSAPVDSTSVVMLNGTAWVPDESGRLQRPDQVEFASLGWPENSFLESLVIEFKEPPALPSADAALEEARKAGFSEDVLATVIREGVEKIERAKAASVIEEVGRGSVRSERTTSSNAISRGSDASGSRSFVSYVAVDHLDNDEAGEAPLGSQEHDRRMQLEAAAIALILEQEPTLVQTQRNNPGYDLYETDADGATVRWIEVKAMTDDWNSRPVTLSGVQFQCAREKGKAYWLYVVEHAGTDDATVVKVKDPAGKAKTYTFDQGWRAVATPTDED